MSSQNSRDFQVEGIVLSTKAFSEHDKLVELFSPSLGKIKLLAKSAYKPKSKLGASLDTLCWVHCETYRGKSFLLVKECSVKEAFFELRSSFNAISLSLYFCQIIRLSTSYEQCHSGFFDLLAKSLNLLKSHTETSIVKDFFHTEFLKLEGLIHPQSSGVNDAEFQHKFESYTGHSLPTPLMYSKKG